MINEMTNDEIEGLIGLEEVESNMLKTRKNGLTLSEKKSKKKFLFRKNLFKKKK